MNVKLVSALALAALLGCATESPRILGHRGARGDYQENCAETLAFVLQNGIVGFETDIRLSKDGHLVIMHDDDVSRVTDGKGIVEEMTLAELKRLRYKKTDSARVPTLAEMLAPLKGRSDVFIELEMKGSKRTLEGRLDEYLDKTYLTAKSELAPGTYAFTSFSSRYLKRMRELHPDAPTGLIAGKSLSADLIRQAKELGCCRIAPVLKGTTKELMDQAHAEGLAVTLWMVQNKADWDRAVALGADATTSDHPIQLKQAVEAVR